MRQNKELQLLVYLREKGIDTFVTSAEIISVLKVSKRQIQKYIANINKNAAPATAILSECHGYKLNAEMEDDLDYLLQQFSQVDTPESRRSFILQKVISSPGTHDVLDFSEILCVSAATIEADLQKTRQYIKTYRLTLDKADGKLFLNGDEKNKRALMRAQLFQVGYRNFVLNDAIKHLTLPYDLSEIFRKMQQIFSFHEIFINDYALNNIILHVIIMIERIRRGFEVEELLNKEPDKNTLPYKAAHEIVAYLEQQYEIKINNAELYNLILLISNNSSITNYAIINAQNIDQYIDSKYIDITRGLLKKTEKVYHLDPFNEELIATFSIHIKNLFLRIKNAHTIRNPLTASIKLNYPLIYDIAVYFAQLLHNDYAISISEDEITFFALHIGGYFENNVLRNTKVTCIFAYSDYYGLYQKQVKRISELFKRELSITGVLPVAVCQQKAPPVDLIISMEDIEYSSPSVVVNPFLTDKDIEKLQKKIKTIITQKKKETLRTCLTQFFHSDIFYPKVTYQSREDIINFLTQDIIKKNYVNENFTQDVFAREKMSSTAFNEIAIPHSLENDALENFIAFATCKTPVLWADKRISVVALIGVTDERRNLFSEVFDLLIDVLSEPMQVQKLLKAENYKDFLQILLEEM